MQTSDDEKHHKRVQEVGVAIIQAMDEEFHDAPDRVLAIVGAAYLDSILEDLLRAAFIENKQEADILLAPQGALGSNGSRYQLAYCLGLIDKELRDDLKTVARIRNAFAHRYDARSFEHADCEKLLVKLEHGKQLDAIVDQLVQNTSDPDEQARLRLVAASGRRKFQDTVRSLFISLVQRLDRVGRPDRSTWYRADPL